MCKFKHITQKISEPKQPTDDRTTWPKSSWMVLSTYKERRKLIGVFYLQKKVHTHETCTYASCKHVLGRPTYLGVEVEMALRAKSTLDTPLSSRTSFLEAPLHLGIVLESREDVCMTRKYRPVPVLRPYILPCNPLNLVQY